MANTKFCFKIRLKVADRHGHKWQNT